MDDETADRCRQLVYLINAPPPLRDEILSNPPLSILTTVCEVALNVLFGSVELSAQDLEKLAKFKSECKILGEEKKSFKKKVETLATCEPELLNIFAEIVSRYA